MHTLDLLINFILHIDQHLITLFTTYGAWIYVILFLIIFCETGLVVFPFLPGDSLLFAAGALAASSHGALNIHLLFVLLTVASITGNSLNYAIGRYLGQKVFHSESSWFFNKKHLHEAHAFYQRFGGKTIIIARFIPIIRTFAPFVAGIGYMGYRQFSFYNIVGALLWVGGLLYVSYLFGNLPFIKNHFSTMVIAIIIVSVLPAIIGFTRRYCCR
ncbi:hypothetical protein AYO45_06020 [Gammaproteobacteria bacterium SCGC AG-212-F23]|nr:hypothetical protein AYO45_06020 [Gammaproteobacteria bacterium SCGC AG-212-F23]